MDTLTMGGGLLAAGAIALLLWLSWRAERDLRRSRRELEAAKAELVGGHFRKLIATGAIETRPPDPVLPKEGPH